MTAWTQALTSARSSLRVAVPLDLAMGGGMRQNSRDVVG